MSEDLNDPKHLLQELYRRVLGNLHGGFLLAIHHHASNEPCHPPCPGNLQSRIEACLGPSARYREGA